MTLDEDAYVPMQKLWLSEADLSMGDHPVVWANCIGQGRSVYAAMGHKAEAFFQLQNRRRLGNALNGLASNDSGACVETGQAQ